MGTIDSQREAGNSGGQQDVCKPMGGKAKKPTATPGQTHVETVSSPSEKAFGQTHATSGGHKGHGIK